MSIGRSKSIKRLAAAAKLAADAERAGFSATVRLVATGFYAQVSRNFATRSALVTFEDVELRADDVLCDTLARLIRDCNICTWETEALEFVSGL